MPRRPAPAEELASIAEAASYLRMSERTIHRWIAEGLLKPYRLPGGTVRLDMREVRALLTR